jgi:hypothetical protein
MQLKVDNLVENNTLCTIFDKNNISYFHSYVKDEDGVNHVYITTN